MDYILMLYSEEAGWGQMTPEQQQQGMAAYMAYGEALTKAGVLKGSNRLRPVASSTTVRMADGKPQVLDGPYVGVARAARRLLPDRRARPRRRDRLGGALPRREPRHGGSSADLVDVSG